MSTAGSGGSEFSSRFMWPSERAADRERRRDSVSAPAHADARLGLDVEERLDRAPG